MTPKSLLRHELSVSSLEDLANGEFANVIDEIDKLTPANVRRVVLSSGKVYFDLLKARRATGTTTRSCAGASRAALSIPGAGNGSRAREVSECARSGVVPGRAAEPGRVVPDPPSPRDARAASASCCTPAAPPAAAPATGITQDSRGRTARAHRCGVDAPPTKKTGRARPSASRLTPAPAAAATSR